MLVQYFLKNGAEVSWVCADNIPNAEDTNNIALLAAQQRPDVLPQNIYINVRLYDQWMKNLGVYHAYGGPAGQILQYSSSVGVLNIKIMPWSCDGKLFLIGCEDDYDRYNVDKIFEEVVLKDCERE